MKPSSGQLDALKRHPSNSIEKLVTEWGFAPVTRGRLLQGNCPSGHASESERCFTNYGDSFFCYNCRKGGDVIELVKLHKKCGYSQAVAYLCSRAGKNLNEFLLGAKEDIAAQEDRECIERVIDDAASFYSELALEQSWFLDLMKTRYGLLEEKIRHHRIGYATGSGLFDHLVQRGHELEHILSAGLFYKATGVPGGPAEIFSTRIIFPYLKFRRAVYLVGRQTQNTPISIEENGKTRVSKYKKMPTGDGTMPETSHPCIDGITIFNEDVIAGADEILVAEGGTDCLIADQLGIPSISPVTTQFSGKQLERLIPMLRSKRVIVVGDSEPNKAGEKGALGTAKSLFEAGIDVMVAKIPSHQVEPSNRPEVPEAFKWPKGKRDLNDLGREEGIAGWEKLRASAVPYPQAVINEKFASLPRGFQDQTILDSFEEFALLPQSRLLDLAEETLGRLGLQKERIKNLTEKLGSFGERKKEEKAAIEMARYCNDGHPEGVVLNSSRQRERIHDEVGMHLLNTGEYFVHGGLLVRLRDSEYLPFTKSAPFRKEFSGIAECITLSISEKDMKEKISYEHLPIVIADAVVQNPRSFGLKYVEHYTKFPPLKNDYSPCNPGYNEHEKIFFAGKEIKPREGTKALEKILAAWPWSDQASKQNFLGILLGNLIKHHHCGETPSSLIMGTQPGLGKTSLAMAAGYLFEGTSATIIPYTDNEEEMSKKVVTALLKGTNFVVVDNIKAEEFGSPTLEALITAPVIDLRVLGSNMSLNRPNTIQTFFTQNEGDIARDILSRSVPVSLHFEGDSNKWTWPSDSLAKSVVPLREQALGEVLGIWAAWVSAGMPLSRKFHRFRQWAHIVGGALEVAGYDQFLDNVQDVIAERDPDHQSFARLVELMQIGSTYQAAALVTICKNKSIWGEKIRADTARGSAGQLSKALARFQGQKIFSVQHKGNVMFSGMENTSTNTKTYQITRVVESLTTVESVL